jgi:glycosyltransferase involved in cell wall biosynthesis
MSEELPHISVVIVTYNAMHEVQACLESLFGQEYPRGNLEIILVDGESSDGTIKVANETARRHGHGITVLRNMVRDTEVGKSLGIRSSKGDLLLFLDADERLLSREWLLRVVKPFLRERDIFGASFRWMANPDDPAANRCCAIFGADPVAARLANGGFRLEKGEYDVICGVRTTMNKESYKLLWSRDAILRIGLFVPRFEEANYVSHALAAGMKYASTHERAYHNYVVSTGDFLRKRIKISRKFSRRVGAGVDTWVHQVGVARLACAALFCASLLGPIVQAATRYRVVRDKACFLYPIFCLITILVYGLQALVCPRVVVRISGSGFRSDGTRRASRIGFSGARISHTPKASASRSLSKSATQG